MIDLTDSAGEEPEVLVRLAQAVARTPRKILWIAAALVLAGSVLAAQAPSALSPAGYEVPSSESTLVAEKIEAVFGAGAPNVVVLAELAAGARLDDAAIVELGQAAVARIDALESVGQVASYWDGIATLSSDDASAAIIVARIVADEDATYDQVRDIRAAVDGLSSDDEMVFTVGGSAAVNLEVVEVSERDLLRAELLVFPITTIVLLVVFRSVVAALLPLIVSLIAVVGTAVVLRGLSEVTLISIFGLNLTTALGLGMAVDYSLFLISRWSEERLLVDDPSQAVVRAVATAGRSILFSGLTTAATIAALVVFDYPLFRSLALSGFVVVLLATLGALIVLPAAMFVLGDRIDAGRIRAARTPGRIEDGRWYRLAMAIMKRPLVVIGVTVTILLVAGAPFLRAEFSLPDDRVLPSHVDSRLVADSIRTDFKAVPLGPLAVLADEALSSEAAMIASGLSEIDGVTGVETAEGVWVGGARVADSSNRQRFVPRSADTDARWFSVAMIHEPMSTAATDVVTAIRDLDVGVQLQVGGESARLVDNTAEIAGKIPLVLGWIAIVTSLLLFASFRSLLMPIKAFLLNLLSLTASFGAIVWIFQDGRLSDFLGYTPTGLTDVQTPVLMFCIAFGLSMDYEVFLLSRIKEEWDATGDVRHSVAAGLQRTGGIITAAAVLMAVVFLSFATGDVTFIQMVGIGLAIAIVVDAFIVRTLLVPSLMALAGHWNWWLPGRSVNEARSTVAPVSGPIDARDPARELSKLSAAVSTKGPS